MSELDFYPGTIDTEPVKRLYGIESELEITPHDDPIRELFEARRISNQLGLLRQFSSNGSRIYVDSGNHPEYATPECQSVRETVAATIAGEMIMSELIDNNGREIGHNPIRLNTRVVSDDNTISWGVHENYQTRRDVDPSDYQKMGGLITHLATRMVLSGAGYVTADKAQYFVAQKALYIKTHTSASTTQDLAKPLINTRDESLSGNINDRRLHIVSGDPTMIPWAAAYKIASTSLVLRMIEHGVDLRKLFLYRPVKATVVGARDTTLNRGIELEYGLKIRPSEVQLALAELALNFIEKVSVSEDEKIMANEWYVAAEQLVNNPKDKEKLRGKVDWIAKQYVIDELISRPGSTSQYQRARAVDRMWGDLNSKGLAIKMRNHKHFDDPLNSLELVPYLIHYPPNGRAELRGGLIRSLRNAAPRRMANTTYINWHEIKYNFSRNKKRNIYLRDSMGENPHEISRIHKCILELE